MAKEFGGGRGGPASRRFPEVTGTKQVDPKKGPAATPVKGAGKPRPERGTKKY